MCLLSSQWLDTENKEKAGHFLSVAKISVHFSVFCVHNLVIFGLNHDTVKLKGF